MKKSLIAAGSVMLGLASGAFAQAQMPAIRIVACDEQVQSRKRGICANHLEPADFPVLARGVSWWYNWHFTHKETIPAGVKFEFLPMAWGDRPADMEGLEAYLASASVKPRAVLAINEPNLKDQAFISPEKTAALYLKIKAIADKHGVTVIGPHMSLGSPKEGSITAMDPIEHKEVTYTFMVPFLKAVYSYLGKTDVPATAFHAYGDMGEMTWAVGMMGKEFKRPVWVTEYNYWKAKDDAEARKYLIQSTDLLERTRNVEGYAWFKERMDEPKNALLTKEGGKLTPMGEAYVAMPVHDEDVYYRLPGRLPAENYVEMGQTEIWPTDDVDGFTHMLAGASGAWLEYNVQVDQVGEYKVALRVERAGKIEILSGDKVLATVESTEKKWQTVTTKIKLAAGAQKIRVKLGAKGLGANWIEFSR